MERCLSVCCCVCEGGCGVEEGHQLHPLLCLLNVGVVGWGGGGDGGRTRGHFAVSRV